METMRRAVMVVCAALLFIPLVYKSRTSKETPARTAFAVLPSDRIYVKVSGAVLHSGIYDVSVNSMASCVIELTQRGDPLKYYASTLATSRALWNGAAVTLSRQSDGSLLLTVDSMSVPERMVLGIPLDIAVMDEADFNRLPGIGPVLAKRIVEFRHKNGGILAVNDLAGVKGIGEKKYKMLRKYF